MESSDSLKKNYNRVINAWCLYDWGSSAFTTSVEAAVLPVYFSDFVAVTFDATTATAYWGYANSVALFIAALIAPILGSIADCTGGKKRLLALSATVGILATAAMVILGAGDWVLALGLFVVAAIGFSASYVFYDALLPHIAKAEDIDFVSSKGYALGYVGGGILLAINIVMIQVMGADISWGYRLTFVTVAIWWAIFSIPLLRRVPEPPACTVGIPEGLSPVSAGFRRLGQTFHEVRKYRQLFLFLLAFWLYNDGIGTIIKMATIYGKEIGIGTIDLIGALLLTQFVGIPFSLAFGKFSSRVGTKRSIMIGLAWYTLIAIAGYFMSAAWHFWALAFAVGMVMGGTQALSRSLFGRMAPKARSAEFFGFYDISSKFAGIAGPALFALVSQLTGSSRLSIVALIIFFIGGIILLNRVDEEEGIRVAEAENQKALVIA
jgi:UMF1 family MFS transporter